MQISSLKLYRSMQCIACVCNFKARNLIVRCDLKKYHFTMGSCSIPGSTSGSRNRAWTLNKMMLFQITPNDKVSHFKIDNRCDALHRSIRFQTWNLHKNAWNFMKLHRSTQFQTWHLHKNMINCIARHNFKLINDVFLCRSRKRRVFERKRGSWNPGILLAKATFKMH